MKQLRKSSRAWTTPRSGGASAGPSSERTSETYDRDKLRGIRRDYLALAPEWRPTFLDGLSRYERAVATGKIRV